MKHPSFLASLFLALGAFGLASEAHAQAGGDSQVVEATIADIQAAYRAGTLTPEQLVEMYLDRIVQFDQSARPQPINGGHGNQPLNSYMHVNQNALRDARRLDLDDLESNDDGGKPLFGIPIILKDNIATRDMPTTAGSVALGGSQ